MGDVEGPRVFDDVSPIFVVGTGRSGTTLLQMMLNAHPNIAIYSELKFFNSVIHLKKIMPDIASDEAFDKFVETLWRVYGFRYLPKIEELMERVRDRLLNVNGRTYELFYRTILEEFAAMKGATRFGEKTPQNIRFLREIRLIFPKAKFVHIVRNPCSVVVSQRKLEWTSPDLVSHAVKWKADNYYGTEMEAETDVYMECVTRIW